MKLSKLIRDQRAIEDGMWIQPDPAEEIEFLARGATPKFKARRDAAFRRLAQSYAGSAKDADRAAAVRSKMLGEIVFDECIIDVRGVWHDEEKTRPATVAEVRAIACTPEGEPALNLAFSAIEQVTERRKSDIEAAEGNSSSSSNGSSITAASATP